MLLIKDYGVQVSERPSPQDFPLFRRSTAVDDCRICAVAGDLWMRSGGDLVGQIGGFSHESEHDLAVMVSEFWENGSSGAESLYSSDSDTSFCDLNHLAERVLFCKHAEDQSGSDLLSAVHSLIPSINDDDLQLVTDGQCNATCIRQSLVKLLRLSGYDAAICSSKRQGSDKVPGSDHEYIDIIANCSTGKYDRLIIEIDFRRHFEIARAVESYEAILSSLPVVYVGSLTRLKQLLQAMAEAARFSLKQHNMPLPPWRSFSYLKAKWDSPYERNPNFDEFKANHTHSWDHEQGIGLLRRPETSLSSEIDKARPMGMGNERKHRQKLEKRRGSSHQLKDV